MAIESQEVREPQETRSTENVSKKKKKLTERQVHEIVQETLLESINRAQGDIRRLDKAIDLNEGNARKLAMLLNAKSKLQQQLYHGVALLSNPKHKLFTEAGSMDLASRIKRALLDESPGAAKLVRDAEQQEEKRRQKDEN